MSVAWYVVLERKIPGFDPFVDGKSLAHASKQLNALAQQAGVPPLMKFFSVSPSELRSFIAEGTHELPPEQWFTAEDGLKTVRALMLGAEKENMEQRICDDLTRFERVLEVALQNEVRWHLAVDL